MTTIASSFRTRDGSAARPGEQDPFYVRFGARLPQSLREEAAGLRWLQFESRYGSQGGPVRLGQWEATPLDIVRRRYHATIAVGETIHAAEVTAPGAIGALIEMLGGMGHPVEILSLHQFRAGDRTATVVECGRAGGRCWALGMAGAAEESTLRAVIAAVNRFATASGDHPTR